MKRIEANDPVAMSHKGTKSFHEGDCKAAFEYWTKAVILGDVEAHHQLSVMYRDGQGVEKDEERELYHTEQAAIGGHPDSRNNLGCIEKEYKRMNRAAKHFIIAAKLGHDRSLGNTKALYKDGLISKDDFAAALRDHHAAIEATKSPQRDAAYVFDKKYNET